MKKNWTKAFNGAWLSFGLLQLALITGCGQGSTASTPGDSLASQAGQQRPELPVRVSRSFFAAEISGTLRVQEDVAESGTVRWNEASVSDDHPGCASFSQVDDVELCFNLMNDVDSFGVNTREMIATGIESYLTRRLGPPCPGVDWEVHLARASRFPATVSSRAVTSFTVQFTAQAPAGSGCAAQPVSVEFSFQK